MKIIISVAFLLLAFSFVNIASAQTPTVEPLPKLTCYRCTAVACEQYTQYGGWCATNCDACPPSGSGPTATPIPSASPTPTPCPGQCNYDEPRQDAINSYCNLAMGSCAAPKQWRNPLTCHSRDVGGGVCTWEPYGAMCTAPNCDCACVLPAPLNPANSCSADGSTATVSWSPVTGSAGYFLRVNKEPYGDWYNAAGGDFYLDIAGTSYSFAVSPGVGYSWMIQAKAPGEAYPYGGMFAGGEARCTPPTPTPIPTSTPAPTCIPTPPPPTNPLPTGTVRETVNGNYDQTFSWTLPAPFTQSYFRITADGITDCSAGDFCPAKFTGSTYPNSSFPDYYPLTPGTNYIWWIHTALPSNNPGCNDYSDAVFGNIYTCNRAFPPTGLNPSGGGTISEGLSSITWNRSSDTNVTHYYLRVDEDPQTPSDFNYAICPTNPSYNYGDVCTGLLSVGSLCDATTCSYDYNFRAGHNYTYWVHEVVDGDPLCYGNLTRADGITATAPTPTPGPWMRINGDVHSNEDIRLPSKQ